jgi:hypothetical protein
VRKLDGSPNREGINLLRGVASMRLLHGAPDSYTNRGLEVCMTIPKGIKETKKNWIVDIDVYTKREHYHIGSLTGQIVLIEKSKYPYLLDNFNEYFDTQLDALICRGIDNFDHIRNYRKGHIIR